jgi:hypothetical protein
MPPHGRQLVKADLRRASTTMSILKDFFCDALPFVVVRFVLYTLFSTEHDCRL